MKGPSLCSVLFLLLPGLVLANGSPIDISEIERTGNFRLIARPDIALKSEVLDVVLDGDYADVSVVYVFSNPGEAEVVQYGFPIDGAALTEDDLPHDPAKGLGRAVSGFSISDDLGKYAVTEKREEAVPPRSYDPDYRTVSTWYVAEIPFPARSEKTVRVRYRVRNRLEDMVYSKSFRPDFSSRTFRYRLGPSGNWGTGRVDRFEAGIDLNKVLKRSGAIEMISPAGYTTRDGVVRWEIKDADLKALGEIVVVYDNSAASMTRYVAESRVPRTFITYVKASSSLTTDRANRAGHGPERVLDRDPFTAWVEGVEGEGVGEWVEVGLDHVCLEAVGIIGGYPKQEALYKANNRIREARVEVDFDDADRFSGADADRLRPQSLVLPERQFNEFNRKAAAPFIDWLADYGIGTLPATRVRVTILGVYPGTKYRDTPITELYILGYKGCFGPW